MTSTPPATDRLPPLVTLTGPEVLSVELALKMLLPEMLSERGLVTVSGPVTVAPPPLARVMAPLMLNAGSA